MYVVWEHGVVGGCVSGGEVLVGGAILCSTVSPPRRKTLPRRVTVRRGGSSGDAVPLEESFPRRGSSDRGSSAPGDRQLVNSSQRVALEREHLHHPSRRW